MHLHRSRIQAKRFDLDAHDPLLLQLLEDPLQHAVFRPAIEAYIDRMPLTEPLRKAAPFAAQMGETSVWRVTVEQVRSYSRERKAAGRANATINRELDVIRGILKRARRWHHFAEDIHPLPVRQNIGRTLTYEEKVKLLKRASARPEWQTVAYAARLALNTTMRGCEIKELRWRDVDMFGHSLAVKKSKTEAGERVIPLNADAWEVILALYRRSQALGGFEPSHFLFPACENENIDHTRHMKSWRTAWRRLTRAIQCAGCGMLQNPSEKCSGCEADIRELKSPFAGFRFHDLRHQSITELAESKASDQTIMSIAGHVSKKMLQHYSHIRLDARWNALDALMLKPASKDTKTGYDTNNDTKPHREMKSMPQVVDFMVELSGIEPLASSLRTRRSPS